MKIRKGAISTEKLAPGAVTAANIAAGAVGTTALGDKAVSGAKIADNAVGGAQADEASFQGLMHGEGSQSRGAVTVPAEGFLETPRCWPKSRDSADPPLLLREYLENGKSTSRC